MPGILPMKVIKVGTSAQTRIAQACDRCRSKKIRCDGFRPCCSQCSNVGFECKTSDKLSRRAFPRGYTESLEERVRALESEVRELKDLLDEKDEKIDMLSRVHSHSPRTESRRTSSIKSSTAASQVRERLASDGDDHFKVQQSPFLLQGDNSDSYFMGTSGGRMLVDSLKRRLLEYGRPSSTVTADSFFAPNPVRTSAAHATVETVASWSTPPRVVSDQMVNIFFQEWAPLFPILHRPSFLSTYTQSISGSHPVQDKKALAHLNLVYAIAALSNETSRDEAELYERQGLAALSAISMECSMGHLQSLLLAQLYCIQKADYTRLLHYKSLAVGISQRLGLHLSQKRFALGTLTIETRKKVFWTLYTLDCFTAACLGLPKQIKDQDVECELPVDADDENVTEKGFQPSLPGEFTKLSSALAQFRCSRILSRVLENNYPTHATHELSMKETWEFNDELQAWYEDLAPHLRLEFKQGRPGTSTISSRCPFLSLCYSYTRMLVHRPAACANISDNTASIVALASASKDAVQVLDLIRERGLSFTFAINKNELLTMTGLGLLLQSVDLDSESKVLKDNQKHVAAVVGMLKASPASHSADLEKLASLMMSPNAPKTNRDTNGSTEISPLLDSATLSLGKANGARRSSTSIHGDERHSSTSHKKTTPPNGQPDQRLTVSTACIKPSTSPSALQKPGPQLASAIKQSPRDSPSSVFSAPAKTRSTRSPSFNNAASSSNRMATPDTNLDFFTFPSDPVPSPKRSHCQQADTPDWDYIISALDDNNADSAADDGQVYEWPPVDEILELTGPQESTVAQRHGRVCGSWSPKIWNSLIEVPPSAPTSQPPRSVMSLSETSLASSEEFSNVDIASTDLVT